MLSSHQVRPARILTFFLLLFTLVLSSCLKDPIDGPQVLPRLVYRPNFIYLHDSTYYPASNTGDILISWSPSVSDTQRNFKGYLLQVFLSDSVPLPGDTIRVDTPVTLISNQILGKDTSYLLRNLPLGHYEAFVWSLQYSPSKADSFVLGKDSLVTVFDFDPRPIENPTDVEVSGGDRNIIRLHWTLPASDTQSNVLGYRISYRQGSEQPKSLYHNLSYLIPRHVQDTFIYVTQINDLGTGSLSTEDFKIRVFTVRNDSAINYTSFDSVIWFPTQRIPTDSTHRFDVNTGVFIGPSNSQYDMVENSQSPTFTFSQNNGILTLTAQNGASFAPQARDAIDLEHDYYKTPLPLNAYTAGSIALDPSQVHKNGLIVYLKTVNNYIVRLFVRRDETGTFVGTDNRVKITGTLQTTVSKLYF